MTGARLLVTFCRSRRHPCMGSAIERAWRSRIGAQDARLAILTLQTLLPVAVAP